uniref:Uncharacterized protein n=1 Tax=Pipistrellus kuhlii TaxID=59472 RepID=A0A7J7YY96_PIPKU|nr:hypothetical protein mPipKuh1_009849 [Pipistrellus kuhlii]
MLHSWWCFIMQPQDGNRRPSPPRSPVEQKHLLSVFWVSPSLLVRMECGEDRGFCQALSSRHPIFLGRSRSETRHRPSTPRLLRSAHKGQGLTCTHRTSQVSENPGWVIAVYKALGTLNPSTEYSKELNVSKQLVSTSHSCL